MLCKMLFWLMMLILGNIIWVPIGFTDSYQSGEKLSAEFQLYAQLKDGHGPDSCADGLSLGNLSLEIDNFNVVRFQQKDYQEWKEEVEQSGEGFARRHESLTRNHWLWGDHAWLGFRKSQLQDESTSYCGTLTVEKGLSPDDLEKIRGALITYGWPSLKITITGLNVKVEPLQACCSPEGECVEEHVLWQDECPPGTKSAGKASYCWHCSTLQKPAPRETSDPEKRACCFPDGYCYPGTEKWCKNAKGIFLEDEMSCGPNPCPSPKLGCCLQGVECEDLSLVTCRMHDGIPLNQLCSGDDKKDCQNNAPYRQDLDE